MRIPESIKRWGPYLLLAIFIIAKIPHLSYAFYWDESWVYAPASYSMYAHGPSLLPSSIPLDLSRGHPLFFPAAVAAWMDIFGNSHVSMHTFCLLISVVLAIALYELMRRLFNQRVAFISLVLLLINDYFFAESSFVLNDILIGLLTFLTIYTYVKCRYGLSILLLTILLYTKESGIVVSVLLFGDVALSLISRKTSIKENYGKIATVIVPGFFLLGFFAAQKHTYGWFLNPGHTSIINASVENTLYQIKRSLAVLFYEEQSNYPWVLLLMVSVAGAIGLRKYRYLFIPLYGILMYSMLQIFSHRDAVFYVFVPLTVIVLIPALVRFSKTYNQTQAHFIQLSVAFSLLYIYFSSINFWESRYLFPVVLMLCIVLLPLGISHFISQFPKSNYVTIIAVTGVAALSLISENERLHVYDRMDVQQQLVDYFEQHNFYDHYILCTPYLERIHLQDPYTGFLRSNKTFTHVSEFKSDSTEFMILDNIEPDEKLENEKYNSAYSLVQRFSKGIAWIEIYKVNQHLN
jgi:hypothetical protein